MQTSAAEEARTLYVGNLASGVDEEMLAAVFGVFGDVQNVEVVPNAAHAFVSFEEEEDARAAQANMHHAELYGKTLTVAPAQRAAQAPVNKPLWETPQYFAARDAEQKAREANTTRLQSIQSEGDGFSRAPGARGNGDSDSSGTEDEEDDTKPAAKKVFFAPADLAKDEAEGRHLI